MSLLDVLLLEALKSALEDAEGQDDSTTTTVTRTNRYVFHDKHSGKVNLSQDKRTASRLVPILCFDQGIAFSDQPLQDNDIFEVRIDEKVSLWNGSIEIGVTAINPPLIRLPSTMTEMKIGTWMLSGNQVVKNGTIIKRGYGESLNSLSVGARVGVTRTSNGNLHFFINGKHQGVAATDIPQGIYAVVEIYGQCTKVSISPPVSSSTPEVNPRREVVPNVSATNDELQRYSQQRQWIQECRRVPILNLWFFQKMRPGSSTNEKKEVLLFMNCFGHRLSQSTVTCDGCNSQVPSVGKTRYYCMECENIDLCENCFKSRKSPKEHRVNHKVADMRYRCDGKDCGGYIAGTRFHCLVCDDFDLCFGCQTTKNWSERHKANHSMNKSSTLMILDSSSNATRTAVPAPRPATAVSTKCEYREKCKRFVDSLKIAGEYFDITPAFNKCFCEDCHKARGDKDCYTRGQPPKVYGLPVGWSRFSIKAPPQAKVLNIFTNWHVAFHGTKSSCVEAILNNGSLLMAGDVALGGNELSEGTGHYNDKWKPKDFDTRKIFVSPSIKYAGCPVYSKKESFIDPTTKKTLSAKVALQVLIRPTSYNVCKTTVERAQPFDPNFSDDELEWSTKERGAVIVTGLLIKME